LFLPYHARRQDEKRFKKCLSPVHLTISYKKIGMKNG